MKPTNEQIIEWTNECVNGEYLSHEQFIKEATDNPHAFFGFRPEEVDRLVNLAYIAGQASKSEWILSKDRLPEIPRGHKRSESVLAGGYFHDSWTETDEFLCGVCFVYKDDRHQCDRWNTFGPSHNAITHWMPLPEAPSVKELNDR